MPQAPRLIRTTQWVSESAVQMMRIDGFVSQLSVTKNHEGTIRNAASSSVAFKGMTGLDILLHKFAYNLHHRM
jgi:hypothetical protein